MGLLIYVHNISSQDLENIIIPNNNYNIIIAEPLNLHYSYLEKHLNNYNQLKTLFKSNHKPKKDTIIIQNVDGHLNYNEAAESLYNSMPIKFRPNIMIIYSDTQEKTPYIFIFKHLPLEHFMIISSELQLLRLLKEFRYRTYYRRSKIFKNLTFFIICLLLLIHFFGGSILLAIIKDTPLTNERIEIVKRIMFQNNSDNSSEITIKTNNSTPILLNYRTTLLSKHFCFNTTQGIAPNYEISIPAHSRKTIYFSYVFNIHEEINKKDILVSKTLKKPEPIDSAKALVISNNYIEETACKITTNCLGNECKLINIYQYVIEHMDYTFDFDYAHKGSISAFNSGKGVCEEYASLFTALAQSINIPCKYNQGIVVDPDDIEYTFKKIDSYHAWPDVYYSDIGWVPVEVTYSDPLIKYFLKKNSFAVKLLNQNSDLYIDLQNVDFEVSTQTDIDITTSWSIRKMDF